MKIALRDHPLLQDLPSRSFATLMELYESNYILMRRLAPELDALPRDNRSSGRDGVDLHLHLLDRTPYTTALCLTHYFDPERHPDNEPDLMIRVYHDARLAEVMPETPVDRFHFWEGERPEEKSLPWRWELNRFLNRWLRYCLGRGHIFLPDRQHVSNG